MSDAHNRSRRPIVNWLASTVTAAVLAAIISTAILTTITPNQNVIGGLRVEHKNGSRVDISTLGLNSPYIAFRDAAGNVTMDFWSTPTGHSVATMNIPNTGQTSLKIDNATPSGAARIVLYDPATGKPGRIITFESE